MLNAVKATKITSRYTPYHRRPSNLLRGITTAWFNNIHSNTTKVKVNVGVMGIPWPVRRICTLQLSPKPSNRSEVNKEKKKKKVQKKKRKKRKKKNNERKRKKFVLSSGDPKQALTPMFAKPSLAMVVLEIKSKS